MLTNIIPDAWRKAIYAVFALIAAAEGAMHTAYTTIGAADPKWLMIALAVTVYVGIAIGAVAASNTAVPTPAPAVPTVDATAVLIAGTVFPPVAPVVVADPVLPADVTPPITTLS